MPRKLREVTKKKKGSCDYKTLGSSAHFSHTVSDVECGDQQKCSTDPRCAVFISLILQMPTVTLSCARHPQEVGCETERNRSDTPKPSLPGLVRVHWEGACATSAYRFHVLIFFFNKNNLLKDEMTG